MRFALTESYAEIEHEASAEHLFVGTSISHSCSTSKASCSLKSGLGRFTPSIGLIGILEGCVESGRVGVGLMVSSRRSVVVGGLQDCGGELELLGCGAKTQIQR